MAKKAVDKQLLSNLIRHVDCHNKVQEEREMWRLRTLEVGERPSSYYKDRRERGAPLVRGRLVSDTYSPTRELYHSSSDNYWTRRLMKAEENDPYRWGHGGYKEQHPVEFLSSSSSSLDEDGGRRERGGERTKRKKKEKRRKKKRRRKYSSSDDGEDEDIADEGMSRKRTKSDPKTSKAKHIKDVVYTSHKRKHKHTSSLKKQAPGS